MFGGSGFGTGQTTFGTGGFGTATSTGGSVFGQQAQPQQTSLFGGGGGTAFGGQQTGLPAFGAGAGAGVPQTGAFGAQTGSPSVFGQQVRPSTGIFSSPGGGISPFQAGQSQLGQHQQMVGTAHPFAAITGTDTMMKNGAASQINTRHQCITCMKEYENKSLEELRLEDYQVNRKGQQQAGMFGGVTAGQPQVQQGASLFSGIGAGTAAPGTSTFGQTTAFGQPTNTTGGGLFGSLNQSKPGVFFGAGANPSTSTAFGGGGSSLGFSFSNPTSQPQTSIFGANNNPATSNTGLGTQGAFSFSTQPQQQQQQGLGLFGQKPLTTPASSAPAFGSGGFGGAPANTSLNKPLFGGGATATPTFGGGSTAPTFGTGTGSLFSTNAQQQQQQNKPFTFSTPFSSTAQPASQPAFGTTNTSTFSFSNPVSTPQINFGGAGTAPTFGNTGTTGTSSSFGAPLSFSLGSNTQQQQPGATGPSFSSGFFSSNTTNPVSGATGTGVGSLFGPPGGASTFGSGFGSSLLSGQQPTFQLQQQQQQQMQQQQQLAPGAVSFATTPYKDNHLFYNLISNRRVEDMTKPTNPLAQRTFREASRRKTSTSISAPGQIGQVSNVSIGLTPAVKNLTFSANSKNSSLTKFHVFDGFQDEDLGVGIDVLSPKTNVKRLVLKNADNNFCVPGLTSASSGLVGGEGTSFGLARRASLLSGMTPPVSKGSFESPLSQQRRVRITSLHNLNPGNISSEANGEPIIRKLDFGDSLMSSDGHLTMLGDHLNHSGEGDSPEVIELFSHANGGLSSKRGSEVDIGGVLNGNAHGSGQFAGSVAGAVCGVICTRPGYYVKPALEELDKKMDSNGNCVVTGFEVGRLNFGRIKYYEPVNVANINLDEIVFFRHKEVVVYPDDENKPDLGKGINAPAEIELERVFPMDKQTNELIRSPEKIKSQNYEQKLRKACERLGAEFVSYDEVHGMWKFKVVHFSKYGLEGDEEDEEEDPAEKSKQAQKGLGGIPQQKLHHPRSSLGVVSLGGRPGPAGDAPPMPMTGRLSLPAFMHAQAGPSHQLMEDSIRPAPPASDVELNPLTPCDTDDDEDDDLDDEDGDEDLEENLDIRPVRPSEMLPPSQLHTPAPPTPKYKPILKDGGTEKTQMMKYAMSMEDFEDRDHNSSVGIMDCQPPIKKSRPSLPTKRVSVMPELSFESGHRLKERLSATQKAPLTPLTRPPPPAIIPEDPVEFNDGPVENLFSSLESKRFANGARLCGAPRVCFLPNGRFTTVSQGGTKEGFKGVVKVEQILSYADKQEMAPLSKSFRDLLERQLAQIKLSIPKYGRHITYVEEEIKRTGPNVPQVTKMLKEELVIWELFSIFWPKHDINRRFDIGHNMDMSRKDFFAQRHRLCQWLRDYAEILFGPEYDSKDTSVLGLLKKGQVKEASLKAVQDGNDWLGVLLSSDPHLILDFSDDMTVLNGMGKDAADIFALISGNIKRLSCLTKERVSRMGTYEWLQYFALFLWYEGPVASQLPVRVKFAIRLYEKTMREVMEDENCALPVTETSVVANLAMHLLKMFSCPGYPVELLINPRTYGVDCLDYKLAFFLMQELVSLKHVIDYECRKGVTLAFAGMLEGIGLYKWAYSVLGEIGTTMRREVGIGWAREVLAVQVLERNLTTAEKDQNSLMTHFCQKPYYMLYCHVKILRDKSLGERDFQNELEYLCKQDFWQDAYNVFLEFMETRQTLDLIGNRNRPKAKAMRKILQGFYKCQKKFVGWEVHGRMLYYYLQFNNPNRIEHVVIKFLKSVTNFVPSNTNQCAFLLDMALSAQKVIQLMLAERVVTPELKTRIFDKLLCFLQNSAPQEYFEGLRSFINLSLDPKRILGQFPSLGNQMHGDARAHDPRVLQQYRIAY